MEISIVFSGRFEWKSLFFLFQNGNPREPIVVSYKHSSEMDSTALTVSSCILILLPQLKISNLIQTTKHNYRSFKCPLKKSFEFKNFQISLYNRNLDNQHLYIFVVP